MQQAITAAKVQRSKPAYWLAGALLSALASSAQAELEFSGKIDLELQAFTEDASRNNQEATNASLLIEPQWVWFSEDQQHLLQFKPMLRIDQSDNERTHADIREAYWIYTQDNWEVRSGLRKEFWGVTEFQHLVDVINQTDLVENISGEEKLGQPMINLSIALDSGFWDFYLLPGFRERTFASTDGRPSLPLNVSDDAQYESSAEQLHTDLAIRWSQSYDWLDLSLSAFHGTNREPLLQIAIDNGQSVLVPYYEQMTQVGTTAQAIWLDWLFKMELIHRDSKRESFTALQTGFEYTLYGVSDTEADLGLILEYGWDERGKDASTMMQNDLFGGLRLTFNDEQSTEVLAGLGHDMDYDSTIFSVEASQRLNNHWKINGEIRLVDANDRRDALYNISNDDSVKATLSVYF